MGQLSSITLLHHSRLMFIPVVGSLIYKFQYFLYREGLINNLIISRKTNLQRTKLLRLVSIRSKYVLCKSYKFGRILKDLKGHIIADFEAPGDLRGLPLARLHEISWTLILASSITPRTKRSLANFIPKNFPLTVAGKEDF